MNNAAAPVQQKLRELLDAAEKQTALCEWGDESFIEPLLELLHGVMNESRIDAQAQSQTFSRITNLLANRLRLLDDRTKNPAIADEVVRKPIIILGLPRSGTTQLHALLAQDLQSRTPQLWEMMLPSPPPESASYNDDPRIAMVNRILEDRGLMTEEVRAMHPFHAQLPEECSNIFEHGFLSLNFSATIPLPSYRKYRERADYRPVYEFHRNFLQHLQWKCPGSRWVLKAPEHLLHLDALLETYPDAIVVQTHRDPRKVMPSNLDLVINLARQSGSARTDVADILRDECLHNWSHGAKKTMALRKDPDIDAHCLDITFDEIVQEPLEAVAKIYAFARLDYTDEVRRNINRFLTEDTVSKHGKHTYSAEGLGLDVQEIERSFADYIARYEAF